MTCSKCLQIVLVSQLHTHYTLCEKRMPKKLLGTILEELFDGERIPCQFCKRKFALDRIEKHQMACEKMIKKRPIFDVFKKKFPYHTESSGKLSTKKASLNLIYPNSKWQKQHLDLVRNLRYRDEGSYEDYVPCPYCGRKFCENTAEKHIEICKNIINKPRGICINKFPKVSKINNLTIRMPTSNSIERPKSNNHSINKTVLSSFDGIDHSILPSFKSPNKTPLLKRELVERVKIQECPRAKCKKCEKKFLVDTIEIHNVKCCIRLKSSATVNSLGKIESGAKKISNKAIRSFSTQRIGEVLPGCSNCGAQIPKKAKYCMMCGNIKLST